jgi:hypothetical protein
VTRGSIECGEKHAFLLNQNSFFKTARLSVDVSVTYSNVSGKMER